MVPFPPRVSGLRTIAVVVLSLRRDSLEDLGGLRAVRGQQKIPSETVITTWKINMVQLKIICLKREKSSSPNLHVWVFMLILRGVVV